jgi:putative transposase
MKQSTFTEEQIAYAMRQVESGTPAADVCRHVGVSAATIEQWKKTIAHLGVSVRRRLRQLEDENRRQKGLVADLPLDKRMLSAAIRNRAKANGTQGLRGLAHQRQCRPISRLPGATDHTELAESRQQRST